LKSNLVNYPLTDISSINVQRVQNCFSWQALSIKERGSRPSVKLAKELFGLQINTSICEILTLGVTAMYVLLNCDVTGRHGQVGGIFDLHLGHSWFGCRPGERMFLTEICGSRQALKGNTQIRPLLFPANIFRIIYSLVHQDT